MLLTRQRLKPYEPQLNLAAMIDVVFLLLIFFLCTVSFQVQEKKLSAYLPKVSRNPDQLPDFEPIHIRLSQSDKGINIACDRQVCPDFDALATMLSARRVIADIPVIIAGQNRVSFQFMVAAMDTCYAVGLTSVAFSSQGDSP